MTVSNRDLHGVDAALDEEITLKAGPFEAIFEPARGYLRRVRLNGVEVVRNIYLHARGPDWETVLPAVTMKSVKSGANHFVLEWTAVNKLGAIDFEWTGTLTGRPDGIEYRCDGVAKQRFATNRTGLCVLVPMDFSGHEFTLHHPDGSDSKVTPPLLIAPVEPLRQFQSLKYGPVVVTLEGDTFEAEDQRNWSDSSYKAYGLRGRRAGPYTLEAGEHVNHAVRIEPTVNETPALPPTSISFNKSGGNLPRVGTTVHDDRSDLSGLHLDFLRVELPQNAAEAAQWLDHAAAAHLPLRVVGLGTNAGGSTAVEAILAPDSRTRPAVSDSVWYAASSFDGLNMGPHGAPGFDGIEFRVTPQVHTFDERSILENAATLEACVRSAQAMPGGARAGVNLQLRSEGPDPRFQSLFGALWVLASVAALAKAGAETVSINTVAEHRSSPLLALFEVLKGAPSFEQWTPDNPAETVLLGIKRGDRRTVLVGNLLRKERRTEVAGKVMELRRLGSKGWQSEKPVSELILGPYEIVEVTVSET